MGEKFVVFGYLGGKTF